MNIINISVKYQEYSDPLYVKVLDEGDHQLHKNEVPELALEIRSKKHRCQKLGCKYIVILLANSKLVNFVLVIISETLDQTLTDWMARYLRKVSKISSFNFQVGTYCYSRFQLTFDANVPNCSEVCKFIVKFKSS